VPAFSPRTSGFWCSSYAYELHQNPDVRGEKAGTQENQDVA